MYSVDEWVEWVQTPEGQWALQEGYELPKTPEFQQAILAVAKGKGKDGWNSKGSEQRFQKGTGKGGKGSKGKGEKENEGEEEDEGEGDGEKSPRPYTAPQ